MSLSVDEVADDDYLIKIKALINKCNGNYNLKHKQQRALLFENIMLLLDNLANKQDNVNVNSEYNKSGISNIELISS